MTKDERKEQKRKEAFRKWARQHAKLRRNLRKHGGDILQSGNFKSTNSFIQHGSVSVHSHSIRVAECSLKLEKFLEKLGKTWYPGPVRDSGYQVFQEIF